jgi:hypothetical protein
MKTATFSLCVGLALTLGAMTPEARPADQEYAAGPAGPKIILLRPSVRLEDVRASTPGLLKAAEKDYADLLLDAAKKWAGSRTALLDAGKLEGPVVEACDQLGPLASRLARGDVNEDAMKALARLTALDERYAVLVQFLRIRTGPGASWNSWTGAITSSAASTLVQAALVSGNTGKVIWKGERLIRNKALKPADTGLDKALTLLYQDFDIK